MKKVLANAFAIGVFVTGSMCVSGTSVYAGLISSVFDTSWTQFQTGGASEDGSVAPGTGGQLFDAEYLLYKRTGNILYIGLQSGFDLIDGEQYYSVNPKYYYAGDLALSFDSSTPLTYEYAFDFGLLTKDYSLKLVDATGGTSSGTDTAGLYKVSTWSNGVYSGYPSSNPFAMNGGTREANAMVLNSAGSASVSGAKSYYRIAGIDLSKIDGLNLDDALQLSAHWTMSCGNDAINGGTPLEPVPEPASMLFFGTGLAGLVGFATRKMKRDRVL